MSLEAIPIWRSVAGGALIGAGAATLLLFAGQVAGISGILDSSLHRRYGEGAWRVAFLAGLVAPALLVGAGPVAWQAPGGQLALAGVLVGIGTRVGSGCTSGHGVCGIANLSIRSLVATLTFMIVAAVTVALLRLLGVR